MSNAICARLCSDGVRVIHAQLPNADCIAWASVRFHPKNICQLFLLYNILFPFVESPASSQFL